MSDMRIIKWSSRVSDAVFILKLTDPIPQECLANEPHLIRSHAHMRAWALGGAPPSPFIGN